MPCRVPTTLPLCPPFLLSLPFSVLSGYIQPILLTNSSLPRASGYKPSFLQPAPCPVYQIDRLITQYLPEVAAHLNEGGIGTDVWAAPYIPSLFVGRYARMLKTTFKISDRFPHSTSWDNRARVVMLYQMYNSCQKERWERMN